MYITQVKGEVLLKEVFGSEECIESWREKHRQDIQAIIETKVDKAKEDFADLSKDDVIAYCRQHILENIAQIRTLIGFIFEGGEIHSTELDDVFFDLLDLRRAEQYSLSQLTQDMTIDSLWRTFYYAELGMSMFDATVSHVFKSVAHKHFGYTQ